MSEKTGFYFMFDEWPMISQLPDVQIGKLIRAIVEYETTGEIVQLPQLASMAFFSVKGRLDRFEANRAKKSAAGKKGMESRWGDKREQAESTESITSDNTDITGDNKPTESITGITTAPIPTPVPIPEPTPSPLPNYKVKGEKEKGHKGSAPAEPDAQPLLLDNDKGADDPMEEKRKQAVTSLRAFMEGEN